jgi:CTP:molybdopterin cytidylyltransferase MocA
MIVGIVLAGGASRRMGRPKALLDAGGESFLERAIGTLTAGGCDEVVVVLNSDDPEITELVPNAGARLTFGGGIGTEQVDSLRAGLQALPPETSAVVALPVDHPLVQARTVAALVEAFRQSSAPIVRPVHGGRPGHPVLFAATVFDELLGGGLTDGARTVVRDHAAELEDVRVDDRGVLIDVDTPADYRHHLGELDER